MAALLLNELTKL